MTARRSCVTFYGPSAETADRACAISVMVTPSDHRLEITFTNGSGTLQVSLHRHGLTVRFDVGSSHRIARSGAFVRDARRHQGVGRRGDANLFGGHRKVRAGAATVDQGQIGFLGSIERSTVGGRLQFTLRQEDRRHVDDNSDEAGDDQREEDHEQHDLAVVRSTPRRPRTIGLQHRYRCALNWSTTSS
jgi:hypothetical protein